MTVNETNVQMDTSALTMTATSDWDAPIARVWQLWADPRQLERWWGPPTYPATVTKHELRPDGDVSYFMTGPDGEKYHGWWKVLAVDEPNRIDLDEGFANEDGTRNNDMPASKFSVALDELPNGHTRMIVTSRFPSREAMDQMAEMGMEEGLTAAMSQIPAVLAES